MCGGGGSSRLELTAAEIDKACNDVDKYKKFPAGFNDELTSSRPISRSSPLPLSPVCVCVCACVCAREREREREDHHHRCSSMALIMSSRLRGLSFVFSLGPGIFLLQYSEC